ncbi:GspH/FimT family pseudopilin [Shewanella corallii]|uniref:GspH/FimT family pseudopilin n=1 Tax=Shewanella corallii TaxID=560080 RepID=UPI0024B35581|nr:GspH/FimT family pseudopilin [Shewanella corallii]
MDRKAQGFTLVELLIALTILVILVSVGIPSMKSSYEHIRADNGIRDIQQGLTFARSYAISYGASVSICANNNGTCGSDWKNGYLIYVSDTAGTMLQGESGNDGILKVHEGFDDGDFVKYSGGNRVIFNSSGLVSSPNTQTNFVYCPGSKSSSMSLTSELLLSGKSRLDESTLGNCN